jgi:endonuclease/exonuclease/phosphatase (EEP) superfamily protein YafD
MTTTDRARLVPSHHAVAPLLALALVATAGCSRASLASWDAGVGTEAAHAPPLARGHLRVLSFNVNYNLADDDEVVAIVRDVDADLVLLQETTVGTERVLAQALGHRYPHRFFEHRDLAAGMGVLSRHPLRERRVIEPAPGGWFPALYVVADTPEGPVEAIDVHLRPQVSDSGSVVSGIFTTSSARGAEARALVPRLSPELPSVVAGDFNESRSGAAITHFRGVGLERAAIDGPTWRWSTSLGELRAELDHVLVDAGLEVVRAERLERGRSDHLPLVVDLRRRAPR